ncbi:MAG: hypothetical protein V4669_13690 [Pseudomonadota bacterium]
MILRRLEGERFSEVVPLWKGLTAVIIGGGPSLTKHQLKLTYEARATSEIRVIAVNDAFLVAPWSDVCHAADARWHRWMSAGIDKPGLGLTANDVRAAWARFEGQKSGIHFPGNEGIDDAVHMLRNRDGGSHGTGLSLDPLRLVTGRNSGFQSLNLAVLAGAKRIVLIGFDGAPDAQGKEHFHGGHPRPTPPAVYPMYRQAMNEARKALLDAGVTVLNASPGSAIDAFPKVELAEALKAQHD